MAKPLDEIDLMMISQLRQDARLPLVTLARRVGLSRSAAQERLRRLERHGVIAGYTIVARPPEPSEILAWLMVKFRPGFTCTDVVPALRQRGEVRLCHSLVGPIDLLVQAVAPSMDALLALREHLMTVPGVAEIQTAPTLVVHF